MHIDEDKIRRKVKSQNIGPFGMVPNLGGGNKSAKFASREGGKRRNFEIARILIGIVITAAMLISIVALALTLLEEAQSFVENQNAPVKTLPKTQVIYTPKGMHAVPDKNGNLKLVPDSK